MARQAVLENVMHHLGGARSLAMPLQQAPRRPFPGIAHHREVLHRRAVAEQLALPFPQQNPHAAQSLLILLLRLRARHIGHLRTLRD
ncbi:MAG: hypothetical protein ACREP9_08920, partial [Candidatus Dormibacteraceae bacterium]